MKTIAFIAIASLSALATGCGEEPARLEVAPPHVLFVDKPLAFQTAPPGMEMDRHVLAAYPDDPHDVLMSGWIHGEAMLTRKAAAVAMTFGQGKLVLLGFRAQHRAQTDSTFPFLFNSIWWSVM